MNTRSGESCRHHEIAAQRVSRPAADPLEIYWIYFGFACHARASPLGLSRHTGLAHNRKRKVRPSSITVMLADTICSSLLILADMKHQRRADGQKLYEHKLFSHIISRVCVCVCVDAQLGL